MQFLDSLYRRLKVFLRNNAKVYKKIHAKLLLSGWPDLLYVAIDSRLAHFCKVNKSIRVCLV